MEFITPEAIGYAFGVMLVSSITYFKGKAEGHNDGLNTGIEKTIEYLRLNDMILWEYDENGELNLLDINGNEVKSYND